MMTPYTYKSQDAVSGLAIAEWAFESHRNCETLVLPDGCRDFIVEKRTDEKIKWFISELSQSAYKVPTSSGTKFKGIRLSPGVAVQERNLRSWLTDKDTAELFKSDQLDEFCIRSNNLSTALRCLASEKQSVLCVAKELGISLRTLERHVKSGTGQSPYFWFSLSRVRKAARSIGNTKSLSQYAIDAGFADQSHMNREMKKWFGHTPAQIKTDNEVLSVLAEPGFG